MYRYLLPIFILGVVGIFGFYHLRDEAKNKTRKEDVLAGTNRSGISHESENGPMASIRTKSKNRPNHPKPTIDETIELLRSTIIPVVDLPEDQSVPERVALLNEIIQQAGIEPHRLRVLLRTTDPARELRFKDGLKIRNIPLAVILKYTVGSTKLRFRVCENGVVELLSQTIQDDDELDEASASPAKKESPSGKTDIFGNDPDTPDEPDPFAQPEQSERSGE